MADWVVREYIPAEDEDGVVSHWLKSFASSSDVRYDGLDRAGVQGHADQSRYWRTYQPIVTGLLQTCRTVMLMDPQRVRATPDAPAVYMAWACFDAENVHYVGIKRSASKVPGLALDLLVDVLGGVLLERRRMTFELVDLERAKPAKLTPSAWERDRTWLKSLASISRRKLDDRTWSSVGAHILDARRPEWLPGEHAA